MNKLNVENLEALDNFKNVLLKVAKLLNKNNITWGLGGSFLLYLYGIETSVADIDIIIDESDIKKIEKLVKEMKHIEKPKSDIYLTEKFYSITIDGIDIDLMIGFRVKHSKGIYTYPKEQKIIGNSFLIDETAINLCCINDWLEAYKAMNRTNKVNLIENIK